MSIDKSWIHSKINQFSDEYWHGIFEFIALFSPRIKYDDLIKCPCNKCLNQSWHGIATVAADIIDYGFDPNYTTWIYHGEDEVHTQRPDPVVINSSGRNPTGDLNIDEVTNAFDNLAIAKTTPNQEPLASPPLLANMSHLQHLSGILFEMLSRVYPDSVRDREPPPTQPLFFLADPSPPPFSDDQIAAMNAVTSRMYQDYAHLLVHLRREHPNLLSGFKSVLPTPFIFRPVPPPSQPLSSGSVEGESDGDFEDYSDGDNYDEDCYDDDDDDDDDDDSGDDEEDMDLEEYL